MIKKEKWRLYKGKRNGNKLRKIARKVTKEKVERRMTKRKDKRETRSEKKINGGVEEYFLKNY